MFFGLPATWLHGFDSKSDNPIIHGFGVPLRWGGVDSPPVLLFLMDPRGLKKVILLSSSREKNYRLYTVITVDWLPAGSFSLNTPAGVSDSSRPVHPGPSAGPVLRLDGG